MKKFRFLTLFTSAVLSLAPFSSMVYAEEPRVTPGYIPEGMPVAADTIEHIDADKASVLFDMRDKLRENVYTKFPESKVHSVIASDIVNKVYVRYISDVQAELDAAKKYCEENGFDMSIMRFDLYDESKIVNETANLISDHETIAAMLKDFIKENNMKSAKVFEDEQSGTVTISYYGIYPEQKEMFENFIIDNNIDADKVFFLVMVGDEVEKVKFISDHETIITMLKDFIKENNMKSAKVFEDEPTGTVAISYYYVYPEQKKVFEDFIKNSNIKEDEVSFMVMEGATEIPDKKATATLKGDVDLNGIVDLADLTSLAKYILSKEAYPLANETAYANADMNDDGVVDILDTSALIEQQLGK